MKEHMKFARIMLQTNHTNKKLYKFYQNCGFYHVKMDHKDDQNFCYLLSKEHNNKYAGEQSININLTDKFMHFLCLYHPPTQSSNFVQPISTVQIIRYNAQVMLERNETGIRASRGHSKQPKNMTKFENVFINHSKINAKKLIHDDYSNIMRNYLKELKKEKHSKSFNSIKEAHDLSLCNFPPNNDFSIKNLEDVMNVFKDDFFSKGCYIYTEKDLEEIDCFFKSKSKNTTNTQKIQKQTEINKAMWFQHLKPQFLTSDIFKGTIPTVWVNMAYIDFT